MYTPYERDGVLGGSNSYKNQKSRGLSAWHSIQIRYNSEVCIKMKRAF